MDDTGVRHLLVTLLLATLRISRNFSWLMPRKEPRLGQDRSKLLGTYKFNHSAPTKLNQHSSMTCHPVGSIPLPGIKPE
jgi:hypothetical protein